MLKVHEIYHSIQGESTYAGLPCTFVRLTYCNLRCTYCDTEHAFYDGRDMEISEIITAVEQLGCGLVEITGGEPLVQEESKVLMSELCKRNYTVLLETGGSLPITGIDPNVVIIMDLKCPSSGMEHKNDFNNLKYLKACDELKFVIGTREDFDWAKNKLQEFSLPSRCKVLFSCVFPQLAPATLAEWITAEGLHDVRFQLQLHKYIWSPDRKGV